MNTPKLLGYLLAAVGIVAGLFSSWSRMWPRWEEGSLGQQAFTIQVVLSAAACVALTAITHAVIRGRRRRLGS